MPGPEEAPGVDPPGGPRPTPPERPSPFRETGDVRTRLPLHSIDPFPDNPKRPIFGKYRRGLEANLEEFAIRDDLKVWPNPRLPGRYFALDGNQRLMVLRERREEELGIGLVAPDDPERDARFAAIRAEAGEQLVDVRILKDLDTERAHYFNVAYDRNHASYDEMKVADVMDRFARKREELTEDLRIKREEMLRRMGRAIRPDKPFIPPLDRPAAQQPLAAGRVRDDGTEGKAGPTEDEPWGPPPGEPDPPPTTAGPRPARETFVPLVIALTPHAYATLTGPDGLLRSAARPIREKRILEAVEDHNRQLAEMGDEGSELNSQAAEMILMLYQHRIRLLKADDET